MVVVGTKRVKELLENKSTQRLMEKAMLRITPRDVKRSL